MQIPQITPKRPAISLPIKTVNSLNAREHWRTTAKRAKKERLLAYCATPPGLSLPLTVKLTRFGKNKRPLDSDAIPACFKALRDGIADKIGVDDGNKLLKFIYLQEYAKEYAVRIEFCTPELEAVR